MAGRYLVPEVVSLGSAASRVRGEKSVALPDNTVSKTHSEQPSRLDDDQEEEFE